MAVIIGNGSYIDAPLGNALNDAQAVGEKLQSLGFEVRTYTDLDSTGMEQAIVQFRRRLAAAGGIGLFYFAGHAFHMGGHTFLQAVAPGNRTPVDGTETSIDLQWVLDGMAAPRPDKTNLLILDACLTTPPGQLGALPAFLPPEQTLVAYATAPGSSAADGRRHGLFTAEWLDAMLDPDRDIQEIWQQVRSSVGRKTGMRQIPWVASSLSRSFRLAAAPKVDDQPQRAQALLAEEPVVLDSRGILPKDSAEQYELTFWSSIKDSTYPEDYEHYLKAYPKGRFASLARSRIERLRPAAPPTKPEAPPIAAPAAPVTEFKAVKKQKPRPVPAASASRMPSPPTQSPLPVNPPTVAMLQPDQPILATAVVKEFKDCPSCPAMVQLPKGLFTMGNDAGDATEKPAHTVSLEEVFAIGKYEITVAEWNACADAGACPRLLGDDSISPSEPVRNVSWEDARSYAQWLSQVTGNSYRLPTEAEWESAARGGTSTRYWWGEQMRTGNANCRDCGEPWSSDEPAEVGSFNANPYGLYDMNGSVREWVSDCWHGSYKGAPPDGSTWDEPLCQERVVRGGSWQDGANDMLVSSRLKYQASARNPLNGFRVVRDIH